MVASWYAMQARTGSEEFLCGQLSARRLEAYCPWIRLRPANPRSRQWAAYFPGYVFVRVDLDHFQLSALRWLPGTLGIVCFGREPASVPDTLVRSIRRRVDEINQAGQEPALPTVKPGESVVIKAGPFASYSAIFDHRLKGSDRVRVLLSLLTGRPIVAELPSDYIQYPSRI